MPASWKEASHNSTILASFHVSDADPETIFTISMLGSFPGFLLPNVNRWEGQLQLPPSDEANLTNVSHPIEHPSGKATRVELTGPETVSPRQKMLAVVIEAGPQTWYLKLSGAETTVTAQEKNFDAFVQAFRPPASGLPTPAARPPTDFSALRPSATTVSEKLAKWIAPPEWAAEPPPSPTSPRALAFKVGAEPSTAEVVITRFQRDDAGSMLNNINRWRDQVRLGPIARIEELDPHKDVEQIMIAGEQSIVFDFAGPDKAALEKRLVVALTERGEEVWFFKISGAPSVVAAQREAFAHFLSSIEFAKADAKSQ